MTRGTLPTLPVRKPFASRSATVPTVTRVMVRTLRLGWTFDKETLRNPRRPGRTHNPRGNGREDGTMAAYGTVMIGRLADGVPVEDWMAGVKEWQEGRSVAGFQGEYTFLADDGRLVSCVIFESK